MGTLKSAKDTERIRLGIVRKEKSDKLRLDNLEGLLTEYLIWVGSAKEPDETKRSEKIEIVKNLIEDVVSKEPFSILPERDQLTAIELENSVKLGDKDTALTRLQLLTTSLGRQISSLGRQAESNRRWVIVSLLVAIAGILVTIVVYLLSRRIALSRRFDILTREVADVTHIITGKRPQKENR